MPGPEQQPRFQLRTENARQRDVWRNLHPWAKEYHPSLLLSPHIFPIDHEQPIPPPAPCPDTALVAFAQLVALRLRARRCLITLSSSDIDYVLTEATKTMSLQYESVEDVRDTPWLGTCSYLSDDGLNKFAMDSWRRARQVRDVPSEQDHFYTEGCSPHWQIISDVRAAKDLAQRAFVRRSQSLRFYAAIPLRSGSGSVIGSLAILDDIPRHGISALEMSYLEDVADTITQHLNATVVRSQRQRSERMVQSLGLFNNGKSSLRHWWLKQEATRISVAGRHNAQKLTKGERTIAANQEFGLKAGGSSSDPDRSSASEKLERYSSETGEELDLPSPASAANTRATAERGTAHIMSRDFASSARMPPYPHRDKSPTRPRPGRKRGVKPTSPASVTSAPGKSHLSVPTGEDFDLGIFSARTYARASNLMREAIGAEGVVFADVSNHSGGTRGGKFDASSASDRFVQRLTSDGDTSDTATSKMCNLHAFSSKEASSITNSTRLASGFEMPEDLLSQLIRRYPNGHIFNFEANGTYCTSSGGDESTSGVGDTSGGNSLSDGSKRKKQRGPRHGKRLPEIMPNAKSIAFYPIWNESQDRFTSCAFVWSVSPFQYYDPVETITYLASWSHSILAELGRLETIASDKAKGSFISSVSHELRSPLHGVLAGVEFLIESELTTFQQEMARTISMAGRTLLDTVNHILDYAKMSSFTRAERRSRIAADAERQSSGASGGDKRPDEIGVTTEFDLADLIEEVVETVVSAHRFQTNSTKKSTASDISVTVNIAWRQSWRVRGSPGAWTRIVQNLVSNALKYTTKGTIAVRLDVADESTAPGERSRSPSMPDRQDIRFSVKDTGIGISKQFLETGLFTPFKQENSHSSGTGLGLSIVQQICKDMRAQLLLESTLGKGTTASVDLVIAFATEPQKSSADSAMSAVKSNTSSDRELNVSKYHWIVPSADEELDHGALGQSVLETAKDWLDCDITQGPALQNATESPGPIVIAITEDLLLHWANDGPQMLRKRMATLKHASTHVLVLGCSLQSVFLKIPVDDLPFIAVFIHQPVGPRKFLRAISSDRSSTQLGSHTGEKGSWDNQATPVSGGSGTGRRLNLGSIPMDNPISYFPGSMQASDLGIVTPSASQASYETPFAPDVRKKSVTSVGGRPKYARSTVSYRSTTSHSAYGDNSGDDDDEDDDDRPPRKMKDTVLLVEDNQINMRVLVMLMNKQNVPYMCANNGREAVDIFRANAGSFFLILMDINMVSRSNLGKYHTRLHFCSLS